MRGWLVPLLAIGLCSSPRVSAWAPARPVPRGSLGASQGGIRHARPGRPSANEDRPTIARLKRGSSRGPLRIRAQAGPAEGGPSGGVWAPYLGLMAASGAALGPFLDGYHSAFGVLQYEVPKPLILGGVQLVVSDFWVPPLFALAAVILGAAYPALDHLFGVPPEQRTPSGPSILACISYFCFQYWCSGFLYSQQVPTVALHAFLAVTAAVCLAIWDRTPTGATMAVVTGVAGPTVELALLKLWPALFGSDLYHYTGPDFMGAIPLWIAWVYACGAPAVGNLGRGFWENGKKRRQ